MTAGHYFSWFFFLQVLIWNKSPFLGNVGSVPKIYFLRLLCVHPDFKIVFTGSCTLFDYLLLSYSNFEYNILTKSIFWTFLNHALQSGVKKRLVYSEANRLVVGHLESEFNSCFFMSTTCSNT